MKKIIGLVCFCLIVVGCGGRGGRVDTEHVGETFKYDGLDVTVKLIGSDFECHGRLFDDRLGYNSYNLGIKCDDGTIVRNLSNFTVK